MTKDKVKLGKVNKTNCFRLIFTFWKKKAKNNKEKISWLVFFQPSRHFLKAPEIIVFKLS